MKGNIKCKKREPLIKVDVKEDRELLEIPMNSAFFGEQGPYSERQSINGSQKRKVVYLYLLTTLPTENHYSAIITVPQ